MSSYKMVKFHFWLLMIMINKGIFQLILKPVANIVPFSKAKVCLFFVFYYTFPIQFKEVLHCFIFYKRWHRKCTFNGEKYFSIFAYYVGIHNFY